MITEKSLQQMAGLTLVVLLLTGCSGALSEPTVTPTSMSPTVVPLSPIATPTPIPPTATAVPTAVPAPTNVPSELQPLSNIECSDLAEAMSQALGIAGETTEAPVEDYVNQKVGSGCQTMITGTGLDFESVEVVDRAVRGMIQAQGWYEDIRYGGGGPTGQITGFRQANKLCQLLVGWEPSEDADCPSDQPIFTCELAPEQQLYTIILNCAQDTTATITRLDLEPRRIEFAQNDTSAKMEGSLPAGGVDRYVLTAMAGQEMTVNFSVTPAAGSAEMSTVLTLWGADGTLLSSGYAGTTGWVNELSSTQDYYIDVISMAEGSVDYTLEVIIPPATPDIAEGAEILPLKVPLEFVSVLAQNTTGVPMMLPPAFPVEEGLAVHPYVYTAEPGEYEISLDFGADCHGAGACHYGSLAGKKVDSNEPVSTQNFNFDAGRAQKVTLAKGIEGYFIESLCGASCDDAKVFWIYNGFQYILGLKAGRQSDVLDLANATINNSIQ